MAFSATISFIIGDFMRKNNKGKRNLS